MRHEMRRAAAAVFMGAVLCTGPFAHAAEPGLLRQPDALFGQVGIGEHAKTMALGAAWDWDWQRSYPAGLLTGYTEVALGEWHVNRGGDEHYSTQFGVTPVLRLYSQGTAAGWFIEGGVGANVISPRRESGTRTFSTDFNVAGHAGVGRRFGGRGEHELALRVQHVPNAGKRNPDAGENFVQLRYVKRF